jgi:hypothetical protein
MKMPLLSMIMLVLGGACSGCTPCLQYAESVSFVRVLDRSGRPSTSASVTASGRACVFDNLAKPNEHYLCITEAGQDVEIEASLEGRTASTTIEATSFGGCAGDTAPAMSVDLTP